jgi:ubiquinone/menaquinone biosynthesis C-methylase UbiE
VHAVVGPKDARLSVGRAYDAIAAGYDEQVRGDDWMRRKLHAHYGRAFAPGDRILDVGCGTGLDAIFLARRGIHVVGIDASSEMIERLRARHRDIDARVLRIEDLGRLGDERFDGIISAFASLNSVADLTVFTADAARLVRPGGRAVLHMLNRFSLWEWLGCLRRRDWQGARLVGRQRSRQFVIGGQSVNHSVYFARGAYASFESGFRLRGTYGLGALRPPHTVRRLPTAVVQALEWADVRVGGWPLVRDAGRFFVLDLERRAS